jgi:hypothetical protein
VKAMIVNDELRIKNAFQNPRPFLAPLRLGVKYLFLSRKAAKKRLNTFLSICNAKSAFRNRMACHSSPFL